MPLPCVSCRSMAGVERVGIEGVDRVVMCGSVGSDQVMQERRQHARQHARQHIFRRNQEEGSVNECGCSKSLNPKRFLYDVAFRKRALLFGTGDYWAPGGPIVQDQFSVYDVWPNPILLSCPRRSPFSTLLLFVANTKE